MLSNNYFVQQLHSRLGYLKDLKGLQRSNENDDTVEE